MACSRKQNRFSQLPRFHHIFSNFLFVFSIKLQPVELRACMGYRSFNLKKANKKAAKYRTFLAFKVAKKSLKM